MIILFGTSFIKFMHYWVIIICGEQLLSKRSNNLSKKTSSAWRGNKTSQNVQIDSDWGMRDWTYALRAVNAISMNISNNKHAEQGLEQIRQINIGDDLKLCLFVISLK